MSFTHLHLHTEYSLLDGAARIKEVIPRAKELGMTSLAITDHGNMFGVIDFYKACKEHGIKPIIGCEVYLAARTIHDKDVNYDSHSSHLILLAENQEGYSNLIKLVSISYVEGFYNRPRVDKELLMKHSKGLIATSACLAGRVQRHLLNRDYESAKKEAMELDAIFGHGNFFLEIQDQGLEEEAAINPEIIRLSRELDIPMVATNDVHYTRREDAEMHDVLLCVQTKKQLADEDRMRFSTDQFYLKSEEEMLASFSHIPEACYNTQVIADRCNVEFKFGEYHLPEYTTPEGFTSREYLRRLCEEGLHRRYSEITPAIEERLEYELSVIENMGFVDYFLVVWDYVDFAKRSGIRVGPGRGSAAGSIVAYTLGITDVDPLKYNLLFERFLNPERVSMPDIDIDFCVDRRGEVIEYIRDKYGAENVSQIITFGTAKARQSVRDVARVMGVSIPETDKIAKAIPNDTRITIDEALETSPSFREMYDSDQTARRVIDMARKIEGAPRNTNTHAGGVVVTKKPLDEYVPLYDGEKGVSTQYTMGYLEELGLLKMDILGLRNLDVIRDAISLIEENYGITIDFSKMEMTDPEVYKAISEGDTMGVFQLESPGMTDTMRNMKPTCFDDVVAGIALFRPGPMQSIPKYIRNKQNPARIKYSTPELAHILDETNGCLIYQEQVMQIVRDLAGYSYGRSDLVRRAMSKKKHDVMEEERQWFLYGKKPDDKDKGVPGCEANGISIDAAKEIFQEMTAFAEYAFNKSHAVAYGMVTYQTAYLKHYYPVEYMASLLTSVMGDPAKLTKYLNHCKQIGMEVLPPSVQTSRKNFTVEDGKIRYGLLGLKDVGAEVIDAIVDAREANGVPKDVFAFVDTLDTSRVNKKAVISLIKAGALDCFEPNRAAHLAIIETLLEEASKSRKNNVVGQMSLFETDGGIEVVTESRKLPQVENFDKRTLLDLEKEIAKVYITGHPLESYLDKISEVATVELSALTVDAGVDDDGSDAMDMMGPVSLKGEVLDDNDEVVIVCMVTGRKPLITKKGEMMEFLTVEDMTGVGDVIVFPATYSKCAEIIGENRVLAIRGHLNFKEGESPKIIADAIVDMDDFDMARLMDRTGERPRNKSATSGWSKAEAESKRVNAESKPPENRNDGTVRDDAVKVRIPAAGDTIGMAGALSDEEALTRVNDIISKYPGENQVLIYLRDGKIVSPERRGVRPTVDFAEEMAELVGNPNVKIKKVVS